MIKVRELRVDLTAGHFRAPKFGTKHSQPLEMNSCTICDWFYFCPLNRVSSFTLFTDVLTPFASGHEALLFPPFSYL